MDKVRVTYAKNFRTVASGFQLMFYEQVAYLYATIVTFLSFILIYSAGRTGSSVLIGILAIMVLSAAVLAFGGGLSGFIGRIRCLSVPKEVGVTLLVQLSVVFSIVSGICKILRELDKKGPNASLFETGSEITGLISGLLFLLFFKKLTQYLENSDLESKVNLIFGCIGISLLSSILKPLMGKSATLNLVVTGLNLLALIGNYVLFAYVVYYMRRSILKMLNPDFEKHEKRGKQHKSGTRPSLRKSKNEEDDSEESINASEEDEEVLEEKPSASPRTNPPLKRAIAKKPISKPILKKGARLPGKKMQVEEVIDDINEGNDD